MSEGSNIEALDDRSLIGRFKQTDEEQYFAALFERYGKRIYALGRQMLRDRSLAEDVVQETFTKALEEINRFNEQDPNSQFFAWLCRICRNLCLDELRKRAVRRTHEASLQKLSAGNGIKESPAQEVQVIVGEVERELKGLRREYRLCWFLFHIEGCTYEEITRITGLDYDEVKNSVRMARRHIERVFR